MRKVGKPNEKVTLLGTYDVDHNNHIVYSLGVDERGKYYSVEEHEYNVGSAYSVYRDYYILEDAEAVDLRQRVKVLKCSERSEDCENRMIDDRVKEYIAEHSFCSDYLFKDWESFLDLLYAEGGRISSILWWDHCTKKQLRESVGSGGYKDPDNDEFIYAETQLYKEGLEAYTLDEIKEYIEQERKTGFQYGSKYRSHNLVPSFNLAE